MQTQISLLKINTVLERTGLKRSALYALQKEGKFPKGVKLSEKSVAWPSNAVDAWIASRIEAAAQ